MCVGPACEMLTPLPQMFAIVIHCRDPYVLAPLWSLVAGLPIVPKDAAVGPMP